MQMSYGLSTPALSDRPVRRVGDRFGVTGSTGLTPSTHSTGKQAVLGLWNRVFFLVP